MYLQPRRNLVALLLLDGCLLVCDGWLLSTSWWLLAAPLTFLVTMIGVYTFHAWRYSREQLPLLARRRQLLSLLKTMPFRQQLTDSVSGRTYIVRSHGMVLRIDAEELRTALARSHGMEVVCGLYWTSCLSGIVFTDITSLIARQSPAPDADPQRPQLKPTSTPSSNKLSRLARFRAQNAQAIETGKLIQTGAGQAGAEELDELLTHLRRAKAQYDKGY